MVPERGEAAVAAVRELTGGAGSPRGAGSGGHAGVDGDGDLDRARRRRDRLRRKAARGSAGVDIGQMFGRNWRWARRGTGARLSARAARRRWPGASTCSLVLDLMIEPRRRPGGQRGDDARSASPIVL
ncbi:hypothetical protein ACU686_29450 [Yinghuangia aomiensis]